MFFTLHITIFVEEFYSESFRTFDTVLKQYWIKQFLKEMPNQGKTHTQSLQLGSSPGSAPLG